MIGAGVKDPKIGDTVGLPAKAAESRRTRKDAEIRSGLAQRLRGRSEEIVEAIESEVRCLAGSPNLNDKDYLMGLRIATVETVEYCLLGIERGERWWDPLPPAVVAQARRAARRRATLEMVLRRCAVADRLLRSYIIEEWGVGDRAGLQVVLKAQGASADRFMKSVAAEFTQEREQMQRSTSIRREERVQHLLAGDVPVGGSELEYEFEGWHLGVLGSGEGVMVALRKAAESLDRRLLVGHRRDDLVWAWLGGHHPIEMAEVQRVFEGCDMGEVSWAVGELRHGLEGWRLTHREARAAFEVTLHRPQRFTRSRGAILLAATLRDPAAAQSLQETYVKPFEPLGPMAGVLRATLLTYVQKGLNAASTAATLNLDRSTVQRHLRKAEEVLGGVIYSCHVELRVALEIAELNEASSSAE